MYARAAALGILAAATAAALAAPPAPTFTLHADGAVTLAATGPEARFGVVRNAIRGGPILMVSLGATAAEGAAQLTMLGDRPPAPGRYPIRSSWDELQSETTAFHASFMPGTVEQPLGWYHGEAGWVTITEAGPHRIAGTFVMEARGYTAADPLDEERWVTVRGSFAAESDETMPLASVR